MNFIFCREIDYVYVLKFNEDLWCWFVVVMGGEFLFDLDINGKCMDGDIVSVYIGLCGV